MFSVIGPVIFIYRSPFVYSPRTSFFFFFDDSLLLRVSERKLSADAMQNESRMRDASFYAFSKMTGYTSVLE